MSFGRMLAMTCIGLSGPMLAAPLLGVRVNLTNSMPLGLYRNVDGPIHRGSIVVTCLDDDNAVVAEAVRRRYFETGPCPNGLLPFLKVVVGLPGDSLRLTDSGVSVNGVPLANTARRQTDFLSRQVPSIPAGVYRVEHGQVFLMATHSAASFDARYFGPTSSRGIITAVAPLLTL